MARNQPALAMARGMDGGSAGIGSSGALPLQEGSWQRELLRKGIHLGEYAILGSLFYRILAMNRQEFYPSHALGADCMTVACVGLYERRQTFILGPHGRMMDVGIDAVGAGLERVMVWTTPSDYSIW